MEHVFDPKPNSPTSPSFPHAFSGNPGGIRTGPPIKTFGGDGLESPQFSKEAQSSQSVFDFRLIALVRNPLLLEHRTGVVALRFVLGLDSPDGLN
jgi:hypothetical protein